MIELYGLAPVIRLICSVLLVVAIMLQAARLFLLLSHREHKILQTVLVFEIIILALLMLAAMLVTITLLQRNIIAGYFYGYRHVAAVPVLAGLWLMFRHKKLEPFLCSLFLLPLLPFRDWPLAPYAFLLCSLYLSFRSVVLLDLEWQKVRQSISRLSVKDAVDVFPGGILYASNKGHTLITNPAMNRLLSSLGFRPDLNALVLWEKLQKTQDTPNISVKALDGKLLIRAQNAGSWLFSRQNVEIGRKKYGQLLALDITDEDALAKEMEESNQVLEETGYALSAAIKNIERLEKEREIMRMKTRVHDILGQRLSILSRLLEENIETAELIRRIKPLLVDLAETITEPGDPAPEQLLSTLSQSMALIGTVIHLKGSLPDAQKTARAFAEVIRECATNAVRHAGARNVYVEIEDNKNEYALKVCNDGNLPAEPVVPGGGITGMRALVNQLEGSLTISSTPHFCVLVRVQKNRTEALHD
jgi:signal transduction histidine kinase